MQSIYHQLHFDEIRVVLGALPREKNNNEIGEKETTTNFLVALEWETMNYRVLKRL